MADEPAVRQRMVEAERWVSGTQGNGGDQMCADAVPTHRTGTACDRVRSTVVAIRSIGAGHGQQHPVDGGMGAG